jgi:hypothetical protein
MYSPVSSAAARLLIHFPPQPRPRVCGRERDVLHRTMAAFPGDGAQRRRRFSGTGNLALAAEVLLLMLERIARAL